MDRITISKVWNNPDELSAIDNIIDRDRYYIRRRGRGYRFGSRRLWQSIPLDKATTVTYYIDPKTHYAEREVPTGYTATCGDCGAETMSWRHGETCEQCGRGVMEAATRFETYRHFDAPHEIPHRFEYRGIDARSNKPRLRVAS